MMIADHFSFVQLFVGWKIGSRFYRGSCRLPRVFVDQESFDWTHMIFLGDAHGIILSKRN